MIKNDLVKKKILAIETSCDESAIAIIDNEHIIADVVISSANEQSLYGGVVPELAAREHEKNIIEALKKAKEKINSLKDISYIAYTSNPGLRVCLNVGEIVAKTLSNFLKIPCLEINHLYGHIFSFWDLRMPIEYPFISLVVSGGNTNIYLVNNVYDIKLLNQTVDDAIGEVYDKVARALNLGYPGGPKIDNLFNELDAKINFINKNTYNDEPISFSGFKTAVLNFINQSKMKNDININVIASSFQKEIIKMIIDKLKFYIDKYNVKNVSIGGGVAANNYLRNEIYKLNLNNVYIPTKKMCGDNALMIALYALLTI